MTALSPGFPGDHHRVIIRSETNPGHLPTGTNQGNGKENEEKHSHVIFGSYWTNDTYYIIIYTREPKLKSFRIYP
jgi:hypothetical protein